MLRNLARLSIAVYVLSLLGAAVAQNAQSASRQIGDGVKTSLATVEQAEPIAAPGTTGTSPLIAAGPKPETSGNNVVSVSPMRPGPDQVLVGFALNAHHTDKPERFLRAIDDIAAAGFNSILVLTPAFQRDGASQRIRIETGPGRAPTREQLIAILSHARAKGLATTLMPVVLLTDPRGNEWRGKISPDNWDAWWSSYQTTLDYFLDIANAGGASVLCVGSELLSTEKQTARWEKLITHARSRFTGRLSYSTNWDHYHVPTFWKKLDLIGINGYWDLTTLTDADKPEAAKLAQRWQEIREQVLTFGESQNKPVLLTEIGYPTLPWSLRDPWNYIASGNKPDHQTQAQGYEAFLTTWRDLMTPRSADVKKFAGVFFYEWDVYYSGGQDDTGYGVRGKPALDLLKKFLSTRNAGP
jgi:hypothetical protein